MSTKRLSKTVIEGGRVSSNVYNRRRSNKEQRATERNYMSKVRIDPEAFDEEILDERQHVYKEFDDKLGPMYRWLRAQVGRKWSEVRSEVFQKFDTRTTAGRHITFDHLLSSVVDTRSGRDSRGQIAETHVTYSHRSHTFYVDDADILQACATRPRRKWRQDWRYRPSEDTVKFINSLGEWLAGRMIGELGGVLYWLGDSNGLWVAAWKSEFDTTGTYHFNTNIGLKYYSVENGEYEERIVNASTFGDYWTKNKRTGLHKEWIRVPAGFEQRGALTESELETFRSLPDDIQAEILSYGSPRLRA